MSRSPDVVVVGGGSVGVCCALELARRGARVTLLERGAELAWACSAGNAGLICPSHAAPLATPSSLRLGLKWMGKPDSPFYLRPRLAAAPWLLRFVAAATPARAAAAAGVIRSLSSASLELHAGLAAAGLDSGFARTGVLNVYEGAHAFEDAKREAADAEAGGLPSEVIEGGAAVREREPGLGLEAAGAVFYPGDAHCDPLRFTLAVGEAARAEGVEVRTRVEALAVRRRGSRVEAVATTAGELRPGAVVLAAGAWSPRLVHDLGVTLPVEGGKGYHVDLERGHGDPALPVWLQESRVIATPLAGRMRLAGTLELAGLDLRVSGARVRAVSRAGVRALPGLRGRRTLEVWRGLRPLSPDGIPIVGRPAGLENLVLATGHGMMGLTLAPVTGLLVGEIVDGAPASHPLEPLSPDRFRRPLRRR